MLGLTAEFSDVWQGKDLEKRKQGGNEITRYGRDSVTDGPDMAETGGTGPRWELGDFRGWVAANIRKVSTP